MALLHPGLTTLKRRGGCVSTRERGTRLGVEGWEVAEDALCVRNIAIVGEVGGEALTGGGEEVVEA